MTSGRLGRARGAGLGLPPQVLLRASLSDAVRLYGLFETALTSSEDGLAAGGGGGRFLGLGTGLVLGSFFPSSSFDFDLFGLGGA